MSELRPYQLDVLRAVEEQFAEGVDSILIQLATGLGKTRIAVELCYRHAKTDGEFLFVAARRELVEQAKQALRARGLDLAWVRTIQELTAPGAVVPQASLVVLDEARHYVSDSWYALRKALPFATIVGLDATPERGDGRGLGGMFEALVQGPSIASATAAGFLVPCEIMAPARPLGPGELAQDPIDAFIAGGIGPGVLFAASVEIAIQYACVAREKNLRAAAVWGAMKVAERDRILAEYAAGELDVLTNAMLLTEGWDAPRTACVVLARGFGTAGSYLQAVGRGLRPSPGKTRCLLLDLRGVSHIHGSPAEPRTWHLEGKAARRTEDDENIRFCPVCGAPVATRLGSDGCDECGHKGEMRLRPPRVLGLPMQRFAHIRRDTEDEKAARLAKWLGEARAQGHKDGRALHRFKGTYGVFPPRDIQRAAMAILRGGDA